MAIGDITKAESLIRQLRTAYRCLHQTSNEQYEFRNSFDHEGRVIVHQLECEWVPTPADNAKFFTTFAEMCEQHPEWSSPQHEIDVVHGFDGDQTHTIIGTVSTQHIATSPEWQRIRNEYSKYEVQIRTLENALVDLVRQNQKE